MCTRTDRIITDQGDTPRAMHQPHALRGRRPDVGTVACCLEVFPLPKNRRGWVDDTDLRWRDREATWRPPVSLGLRSPAPVSR